jgi:hypothetical protein
LHEQGAAVESVPAHGLLFWQLYETKQFALEQKPINPAPLVVHVHNPNAPQGQVAPVAQAFVGGLLQQSPGLFAQARPAQTLAAKSVARNAADNMNFFMRDLL